MTPFIESRVPYSRRVFCNRNLRLDRIECIGFDMDYTLALYRQAMEHLQAEMVLERLVAAYGYPRDILSASYDPSFAIRGLTVDMMHGNVFKMDAHRFVGKVWHGAGPLDRERRRETYTNRKVAPADPNLQMVDTLFSLPEISLYCQLVDWVDRQAPNASVPSYDKLWRDLRHAMDSLHADMSLKAVIMSDIPKYIFKDPELAETLHRFRSAGKRLFVLTNSEAPYTEAVMSFLLDGAYPGYPRWSDFFEFVITSARKPLFFENDEPIGLVQDDGSATTEPLRSLDRGKLYTGGGLWDLQRLTGMIGEEVLYVGDHIYGDILRSKRRTSWRTAMVIQELERELDQLRAHQPETDELHRLEEERFQLNLERAARAVDKGSGASGDSTRALKDEVRRLTRRIADLERGLSAHFNASWGEFFRDRGELSAFGEQVEDYACVYTAKVSSFRLYSPFWYFRSPRSKMAHELQGS